MSTREGDWYVLGVDYGERRVGLALAHNVAQMPQPYGMAPNDERLLSVLETLVEQEAVGRIVVGVPRNMDGSLGAQAKRAQEFADMVAARLTVPVAMTDETLSSLESDQMYGGHGAKAAGLRDARAAAIILERYFAEQRAGAPRSAAGHVLGQGESV